MGWQGRRIVRKSLTALVAVALVFGLLHAPSMMLGAAAAAGVDCHAATIQAAATPHSHVVVHDPSAPAPSRLVPPNDSTQMSSCPLANITALANPAPDFAIRLHRLKITAAEPRVLLPSVFDLPDPPPRFAS
jgi:hypothetical protein